MVIRTRDPLEVVQAMSDRVDVLIEGGPTLAGAFLRAGVVDRIVAYVKAVGRENVIAGTDCGLGGRVHAQIVSAKLQVLAEGARLASKELWH